MARLLAVRLANLDGDLRPEVNYPTLDQDTVSLAVGDVNNDGKADLVACNYGFTYPRLKGGCPCSWETATAHSRPRVFSRVASSRATTLDPIDVALADVDHDGIRSTYWWQTANRV